MIRCRTLWAYRHFIVAHVQREVQQRYTHSLLGGLWAVLNPLMLILIYTVVFSQIMRPTLSDQPGQPFAYSIYLCAGLLPWNTFADLVGRMQGMFLQYGNLIKKANFPRACLPIIVTCASLIDFAIVFVLYLAFLVLSGHFPGTILWAFLPVFAIQCLFAIGFGLLTATVNVFFRDVGHVIGVLLQFWFWFTPIVYSANSLPPWVQTLLWFNPMYPLTRAYQNIFLNGIPPEPICLLGITTLSLALLWWASRLFVRLSGDIVDEL